MQNLISRGIDRIKTAVAGRNKAALGARELEQVRHLLGECAAGFGGEVSARRRAARLGEIYLHLNDNGRRDFLRLIAHEFGPKPATVARAHEQWQATIGTPAQWDAEAGLRAALRSDRTRILTNFNALPQGVKFLVDLRADLLRYLEQDPQLAALDRELEARLAAWFDVGFLELQRITWNSSAALLEKLIQYEAVHEIRSWTDLKNRLDSDRRLYAFFHPCMPAEPLIFVEVALTDRLADNVQKLLDESAPVFDVRQADTAIFYSISNTQAGLRGVSFGNFLLKRVIEDLQRNLPRLRTFATLSPMPKLSHWAQEHPQALEDAGVPIDADALSSGKWAQSPDQARSLRQPLLRLAAHYLTRAGNGSHPLDPVARFHLGNGARIERVNFLADTSVKGYRQSFALMLNYLYQPDALEDNVEAYIGTGSIAMSSALRRLARP